MPLKHSFEAMGTKWTITVWDERSEGEFGPLAEEIETAAHAFDETYSRFISTSFVSTLASRTGVVEVPEDLTKMLLLYAKLYEPSQKKLNPLIGFALSDAGYDANYSLKEKASIRSVPDFLETVQLLDATHISIREPVLIDVGALGKGFFVDQIASMLRKAGKTHFLVDGSGDVVYEGPEAIRVGLEDPRDPARAIGVAEITGGALCGSAVNRRAWEGRHHILDPNTGESTRGLLASWVYAKEAAVADAIATSLFLASPESLSEGAEFEYLLVNEEGRQKISAGFPAEMFSGS